MKRIAKFEKVSLHQFMNDIKDTYDNRYNDTEIRTLYEDISMPVRATAGSAGYDFFSVFDIELTAGETIKIPTGIRVRMHEGWVLKLYPRSSLGFKYQLQLNNTVGIIDQDYYSAENEGHISIKLFNADKEGRILSLKKGQGFAQGIFVEYGITEDDDTLLMRTGGFGSTDK